MRVLFILFVILFLGWFITDSLNNVMFNKISKELRKIRKDIKKIKNNEFYIFDYIESNIEENERGNNNEN